MEIVNIGLAGLIAIVSLILIGFVLHSILSPLIGSPRGFTERWKLRRRESFLADAEQKLRDGSEESALVSLRASFFFDHVRRDPALIATVNQLHLTILGTILTVADRRNLHIENLAVVEDLLSTRIQLMRTFLETDETRKELLHRRRSEKKPIPEWAAKEYHRKLTELREKIVTNRKSLEKEIEALFKGLSRGYRSSEATYH